MLKYYNRILEHVNDESKLENNLCYVTQWIIN